MPTEPPELRSLTALPHPAAQHDGGRGRQPAWPGVSTAVLHVAALDAVPGEPACS